MRISTPVLFSLLLSFLLTPSSLAQETPAGVFRESVDVRVLNLEIVVVDDSGRHVHDLVPQDFRILVDGEPIEIRYFTEVAEGHAKGPKEEGESAPAISQGEMVGRSYVVFIDEFFSMPGDRDAVVQALVRDLGGLEPGDQMAIVAWNAIGMESSIAQNRRHRVGAINMSEAALDNDLDTGMA